MAGGFSENEYLMQQVRTWAANIADLRVIRASDRNSVEDGTGDDAVFKSWTSVVQGAVLRGLGHGMVSLW
jgi:hypothetical protein